MKTLITASALLLASNVTFASSLDQFQRNGYDKPVTLTEPMRSSAEFVVSLDTLNEGNSDHSSHARDGSVSSSSVQGFASSLDGFNSGNPDHA